MKKMPLALLFIFPLVLCGTVKTEALTNDEALESVYAGKWNDPDLVFHVGDIVGFMRYCNTINPATVKKARENVIRWMRLAASDYDADQKKFVVSKPLFDAMLVVFEKGVDRGKREGKYASSDTYEWNKGCKMEFGENPNELNHKWLKPPRFNLGRE